MIRLIIVFVAISIFTPIALTKILPDAEKLALKSWLISNEMTFIAGFLLGEEEVPDAHNTGDLLDMFSSMDYSESWDHLNSSAQQASQSLMGEAGSFSPEGYGQQFSDSRNTSIQRTQEAFPSNEWFSDYQFESNTQVNSVQSGGCLKGKTISMNSHEC